MLWFVDDKIAKFNFVVLIPTIFFLLLFSVINYLSCRNADWLAHLSVFLLPLGLLRFQFRWVNLIGWMILVKMFLCMLSVLMPRCLDVSIAKYRFRQYFYYHHSLLIMFDIEASAQINLDDAMSSFAMPINSCCTIRLRLTFLHLNGKGKRGKKLRNIQVIC